MALERSRRSQVRDTLEGHVPGDGGDTSKSGRLEEGHGLEGRIRQSGK